MDLLARETGRVKGRVGDVALLRFISGWFGGSLLLIAAIAIVAFWIAGRVEERFSKLSKKSSS